MGGGMGGFFLVYFYFLYIFHVLLSSWGSTGLFLMVLMGPCHPMGDGPFLHGRMSPAPSCPSRLVLPQNSRSGREERLEWARGREWVSLLHPSTVPVLLKDAIVPVPAGVPVPYLHAPLAWTPPELWCLLLQSIWL